MSTATDPSPPTDELFRRAERLLEHSLAAIEARDTARQHDRQRVALELEQALLPLNQLNQGLTAVIESMARAPQDNRLQRWQGQLQQLLTPLDASQQNLRELLALLDLPQPLDSAAASDRDATKQQQLVQLLQLRQKQVLQLQAELVELRLQLFSQGATASEAAALEPTPASDQGSTPSIFS